MDGFAPRTFEQPAIEAAFTRTSHMASTSAFLVVGSVNASKFPRRQASTTTFPPPPPAGSAGGQSKDKDTMRAGRSAVIAALMLSLAALLARCFRHSAPLDVTSQCTTADDWADLSLYHPSCSRSAPAIQPSMMDLQYSIQELWHEAGILAYRVLRGAIVVVGVIKLALSIACSELQESNDVVMCNMMRLAIESVEDEVGAFLQSTTSSGPLGIDASHIFSI